MGQPKLTPWFDGKKKPKREGVYQVKDKDPVTGNPVTAYSRWAGAWHSASGDRVAAARTKLLSYCQDRPWRGHAQPSKEFRRLHGG